jgi:hypothetical protein
LFADYLFGLTPVSGIWTGASAIYVYVKSKRFSAVMSRLFRRSSFPFRTYLDWKLREDNSGTLATVMAFVEGEDAKPGSAFGAKQQPSLSGVKCVAADMSDNESSKIDPPL